MIKKGNERITITLRPKDQEILKEIMKVKNCKTYTMALRYILDTFYVITKKTKD